MSESPEKSSAFASQRGPRGKSATTSKKAASARATCAGRSVGPDHVPRRPGGAARGGEEGAIRGSWRSGVYHYGARNVAREDEREALGCPRARRPLPWHARYENLER